MYKKIILETFNSVFKNSKNLTLKLLIPTIIISFLNYFIPQFISKEIINNLNIQTINLEIILIPLIICFILIMTNISIAVTTYRVLILGEDSVPKLGSLIFGLREFKFLFKSILFTIIIALLSFLVSLIPNIGIYILPILIILLISRLSLIFPAIACDEKVGFLQSWKYTKNFKLLTLFMFVIFPLIFSFIVGFVYTLAIEFLIKLVSTHMTLLYSILNVFIMVFTISAVSSVYNHIKPRPFNKPLREDENQVREIIQSSRKGIHKIIIDDKHKINFEQLKEELSAQFSKLGFTEVAYLRQNAWLVKKTDDDEAYISLRHDGENYIIQVKNSEEPSLKILKT